MCGLKVCLVKANLQDTLEFVVCAVSKLQLPSDTLEIEEDEYTLMAHFTTEKGVATIMMCLYKKDEETSVIEFKKISGDYGIYNTKSNELQKKFLDILTEYNEKAKKREENVAKQQKVKEEGEAEEEAEEEVHAEEEEKVDD